VDINIEHQGEHVVLSITDNGKVSLQRRSAHSTHLA
jgi:hypothetical protein